MPHFTHNHRRIFYREQGSGPLLLILPGNTATSACHLRELEHFGERFHAVSPDFLGTGQSDRLDEWPLDWYEQGAHTAAALAGHLGAERFAVMGTSGGGFVALLTAAFYPDAVQAVVADSTVDVFPPDAIRYSVAGRAPREPGQVEFWQFAQGDDWEVVVEADSDFLLRLAGQGGFRLGERLECIRCPALLTASQADDLLYQGDTQQLDMLRRIRDCRAFITKEGGHPLMWSRPNEFFAAADEFLAQAIE